MTTPKKRLYLAIIALGGLALVIDRFVLTSSATNPAGAEASLTGTGDTPGSALPPSDAGTLPIPELPFPRGLTPFDPRFPVRDLFAPPGLRPDGTIQGSDREQNRSNGNSDVDPLKLSSMAFPARYRLDGVLVREGLEIAIVNGSWVNLGQTLGGCTLTDVAGHRVVFECHDGDTVLEVKNSTIP